jgi:hypothetical protein
MVISLQREKAVEFLSPLDLVCSFHALSGHSIDVIYPGGDANAMNDFNPVWIAEFKHTNAYEVWQRITDPMLFDIIEPRYASHVSIAFVYQSCFTFTGIHVMRSLAQFLTLHYASLKAFKNSNSNSNLHQREKQSRVHSTPALRTSLRLSKA